MADGSNPKSNTQTDQGIWVDALPAVFVLLWATGFIGSKLGAPYSEPFTFLAIRFFIAAVIMLGISLAMKVTWPGTKTEFAHTILIGILVHGIYLGGVFWAIDRGVSAGLAALVVGLQPVLTSLAAGPVLGEKVVVRHWLGLLFGFTGVALVVWQNVDLGESDFWGIGACFIAMIGITFGTLYQKRTGAQGNLRSQQAIQLTAAAVFVFIFSALFETQEITWSGEFIFALSWLTCVLSLGTFTLLYFLIRRGAASKVSSLMFLTPPVAAIMAWFLFGETLTAVGMAGIAIAAVGVALTTRR